MRDATCGLIAVGDVCLGDHPMVVGWGVGSQMGRHADPAFPFALAGPLLDGGDLVFCNLETPLSHDGLRRGVLASLEMRGAPEGADRLAAAGFNVVNIANNHILQHGEGVYRQTIAALEARGLSVVGVAQDDAGRCVRRDRVVNGIRVAFLGYAFEPDRYYRGRPFYADAARCDLAAEVAASRRSADVVICSLHWGREFVRLPSREMVGFARGLVDAGAGLVLGHHPHVFQGIERYRDGVIAYSLGNFVTDMMWDRALTCGLALRCRIGAAGVIDVEPVFSISTPDYQPRPATPVEHVSKLAELRALSVQLGQTAPSAEYERQAKRLVSRNRRQSYQYFLRHLRKYPAGLASQFVRRAVGSKLQDLADIAGWKREPLRSQG